MQAGDHVTTLKIIPFYVHDKLVDAAERFLQSMTVSVMPWLTDLRVELIQSYNETITTKVQKKGMKHSAIDLLSTALLDYLTRSSSMMWYRLQNKFIALLHEKWIWSWFWAPAICDRQDVVPAALTSLGGHVSYFGMPVDPKSHDGGHLDKWLSLYAGCVRSPAFNGLDLVLDRLMAGLN